MVAAFILALILLLSSVLHVLLGLKVYRFLRARCPSASEPLSEKRGTDVVCLYVLGLLIHLTSVFFLKCFGAPWWLASLGPLIPALFPFQEGVRSLKEIRVRFNVNYVLWFFVTASIGVSLISVSGGAVQTAWTNNYGDVAFHIGMISSFTYGDNFPPEYHIFPGVRFSYPFFVNLWTSAHWWISSGFQELSFLFFFQWLLLWTAVFILVRGNRFWLLPWAILFGGGSYFLLGQNSGSFIPKGAPWSVFLTTIWVTQRGAMLGSVVLLSALRLFFDEMEQAGRERSRALSRDRMMLCGILLGAGLLAHAHLMVVGVLLIGLSVTCRFFWNGKALHVLDMQRHLLLLVAVFLVVMSFSVHARDIPGFGFFLKGVHVPFRLMLLGGEKVGLSNSVLMLAFLFFGVVGIVTALDAFAGRANPDVRTKAIRSELKFLLIGFSPALLFIPWLVGKAHSIKLMSGWLGGAVSEEVPRIGKVIDLRYSGVLEGKERLMAVADMWLTDAFPWLLSLLLLWLLTRKHLYVFVLAIVFILGNSVQLAFWEWDQLKLFLGLYVASLLLWSLNERRSIWWGHFVCILLLIPALYECAILFKKGPQFTVYDEQSVNRAAAIRARTSPGAIIAGKPNHNSLITLTGRPFFFGYEGTLSSHGIVFQARKEINENLSDLASCRTVAEYPNYCPDLLLWDQDGKGYWKRPKPPATARASLLGYLYVLPGGEGLR